MRKRDTVDFVGLRFDRPTMAEAIDWLRDRAADDAFGYIVTPNVDHVVQLERMPAELRPLYEKAALCLCDSRVLATLAQFAGVELTVVPGSDLVVALFDAVLRDGDSVCIIGGDAVTIARLREDRPGLALVQHVPPMGLRHDPAARASAVAAAIAARARFTLFAVGCPQQELLAFEMARSAGATGTGLCIGAAMDFVVGTQTRAPRVFQRAGLEWLWRLAGSPRRLGRRYLWDGPRIVAIVWRWRRARSAIRPT